MAAEPDILPAFAQLRHALWRRRLSGLDVPLRIQLVLLATLVNGFVFWQVRIPFDAERRVHGPTGVAIALAAALGTIVVIASFAIALRHRRRLDEPLAGPEWLALPVPSAELREHLAWESRSRAWVAAAFAPAPLAAAVHFVPPWALVLEALAFAAAMAGAARLATRVAEATRPVSGHDPWLLHFARVRTQPRTARLPAARWSRAPRPLTLLAKDARLARRPTPARARLALPIAFGLASCAAWMLPLDPPLARFFAFALALGAAAAWAEFLIALAGADRVPVLRALPLTAADVWAGRAAWIVLFLVALIGGQALAARGLAPAALQIHLVWLAGAVVAIGLLGAHYGITLAPRSDLAQRFLTLGLAISVAASMMIPLLGWVVLLAAVIHSARRVPQWERIEFER